MVAIKGFCFYNSNKTAGASQTHKHLQVVPYEHFSSPVLDHLLGIFDKEDLNDADFKKINLSLYKDLKYSAYKFREMSHKDTQE